MAYCPHCGRELSDELQAHGRFCPYCGESFQGAFEAPGRDVTTTMDILREDLQSEDLLTPEDRAAVEGLPAGSALLVAQRGGDEGSRFLLDAPEVSVGRSPDADIFLDDVTVSRKHAVLQRLSGEYVLRDAGSLNGTYVNKELVESRPLVSGDEVQIGKFRLLYLLSPQGAGPGAQGAGAGPAGPGQ